MNSASTWLVGMDQRKQNEEALLVTAAQSDPAAFADLYEHFLPIVYRYLLARLGSTEDAADLTQQVFTRALSALPGFKPNGPPFSAWLLRIARNAAIDASRRRRPSVQIEQIPADRHPVDLASDPEDLTLRREAASDLHAMLEGLNDEQRDLIVLRFAVGLTSREIAEVVGKREAAVRKQLSRTLHTLKERYDAR